MKWFASLLVAAAIGGCSVEAPPPPAADKAPRPSVLEPGAFPPAGARSRASTATPTLHPTATSTATPTANAAAPVRIELTRIASPDGEDGHGSRVRAVRPVAIDLIRAGGWPGTALPTTLRVGDQAFHDKGYPTITTMRFIVADEVSLPRGVEVALEMGGPGGPRRVIAPSLPGAP